MLGILSKILGDPNERVLRPLYDVVAEINSFESKVTSLTDQELMGCTSEFRARLRDGETLDDILPEAFAVVREASKRKLGMRHYDVQMIGGIVLHQGMIAEMRTGEGKTLVATLPAYLNSLDGTPVHVVTVNDYLSKRDASWMGGVYEALGIKVGCIQNDTSFVFDSSASVTEEDAAVEISDEENDASSAFAAVAGENMSLCDRKTAYACDIVYGTNHEFGFDHLRDNIAQNLEMRRQTTEIAESFAIVDEVDNILIDEARTPLIISGPADDVGKEYRRYAEAAKQLEQDVDFEVDEKRRDILLTEEGVDRLEQILRVDNLYGSENGAASHFAENALRAKAVYRRDKDYVVKDGELILVDEFTGRLMHGRRLSDGMHQALEAKEGISIRRETRTYASITIQNFFRMYKKMSGMTGTAATEAEEFHKIYDLDVVQIPTNREDIRDDLPDRIYMTESAKWKAVVDEVFKLHKRKTPVLVGTTSIEKSEKLAEMLKKRRIPVKVLNAKHNENEAGIIAQAGRPGAVTVSTSMAGRGTDILLGGNPETLGISEKDWKTDQKLVLREGGLFVLGTERHESRRIDNQLRGRAGRQGDPGKTLFCISAEDELMRRFGGDRIKSTMGWVNWDETQPVENKILSKTVESAQIKVEAYHFEIRKHLVEYDDVVNAQRQIVYKRRRSAQEDGNIKETLLGYVNEDVEAACAERLYGAPESWDFPSLRRDMVRIFPTLADVVPSEVPADSGKEAISEALSTAAENIYEKREGEFGADVMERLVRLVLLRTIDKTWCDHLTIMENMRQGIGLQAVGQRDPLVQYRSQAFEMFGDMVDRIESEVARTIFSVAPNLQVPRGRSLSSSRPAAIPALRQPSSAGSPSPTPNVSNKEVGRNAPCPCGSGKKFKRCHGNN